MEFDIGGKDRALRNDSRYKFREAVSSGEIFSQLEYTDKAKHPYTLDLTYVMPLQIADFDPVKGVVRASKRVVGMKELWYRFLSHYYHLLDVPDSICTSVCIDTATVMWETCHNALLQEKQEAQLDANGNIKPQYKELRESLIQIEYSEANRRMRGLVYQAKAKGKNLILVHHADDEYGNVLGKDGTITKGLTGRRKRKGWGQLGDSADMIVHTYLKDEPVLNSGKPTGAKVKVPYCTIELAELLELSGMEIREPTFDQIETMLRMMRGES